MRIALVVPPAKLVRDMAGGLGFDGGASVVLPPLDLLIMASSLRQGGHQPKVFDGEPAESVRAFEPDLVIGTVSLATIEQDADFLFGVGSRVWARTAVTFPAILETILRRGFERCLIGEVDIFIDDILAGKSSGTAWLENDQLKVGPELKVEELDSLPLPDWDALDFSRYRYHLLGSRVATLQTSRGCPFSCAYYCPYPLVQGNRWRAMSPEKVAREVAALAERGIKKVLFRDATFTLNRERSERICDLLQSLGVEWWCETRANCLDRELLRKMHAAGCRGINLGVETGDDSVRTSRAKAGVTRQQLSEIRATARELGLRLHFLLMVGLPEESRRSLYMTYRLVRAMRPDSIGVTIVTPYPGTPLYEDALRKGWVESQDWARYGGHQAVMRTDFLEPAELVRAVSWIERGFAWMRGSWKGRWAERLLAVYFWTWARGKR